MNVTMPFQRKSQHAYRELKRRIMTLDLAPGQLLHEPDLKDGLALGRTPVREAIQRLAAENLVIARPRQTAFVAPILAQDLAQMVEMRLVLEAPAARFAAERGSRQERARLEAAREHFREEAAADNRLGVVSADAAIHALIAAMGRNTFLADSSERLAALSQRLWWLSAQNAHRDDEFIQCHDELVRAIRAGDGGGAERLAVDHIGLFQRRLGRLVQAIPLGTPDRAAEEGRFPKALSAPGTAA